MRLPHGAFGYGTSASNGYESWLPHASAKNRNIAIAGFNYSRSSRTVQRRPLIPNLPDCNFCWGARSSMRWK